MRNITGHKTSAWMTALLAAGFLLRAFIPVGYMPGNLLAGDFVELCPIGITFGETDHSHHAGHDTASAETDPNKTCPLGLGLKFLGAPVIDLGVPAAEPPSFSVAKLIDAGVVAAPPSPLQPRAPPVTIPV